MYRPTPSVKDLYYMSYMYLQWSYISHRTQVATELLASKNATGKVSDRRRRRRALDSSHIRHHSSSPRW